MLGPVLLPQQQQRHGAPFQLLVDLGPIGQRPCRRLVECRWREEPPLQLGIVQSLRHRPGDADDGGTPQIFADCRSAHPNRDGDLPLANAKGVPQSQNFSNLPHRRSLGGHRTSPCMVAKEASSAIRSSTARASDRPHRVAGFIGMGGRLPSESVAGLRRNLEGSVRSQARPARKTSVSATSEAGLNEPLPRREPREKFKANRLRRSPASNACTTSALWHGCC